MNELEKKKHLENLMKKAREYDQKNLKKIIKKKSSNFESVKIKGMEWMEDL